MEKNQRKIGVVLSYLLIMLHAAIGFIYVPILLHFMGRNEYGLYQLMGSLIAYFSVMDFGLTATVIRFYTKYQSLDDHEKMNNVIGLSKRLYSILTVLTLVLGVFIFFNIENIFGNSLTNYEIVESKKIFIMLLINIVITLMTNVYSSLIIANEKFVFIKSLSIIQEILQPIAVVSILAISPKAFTMTLILTVSNLIVGLIKVLYTDKILGIKGKLKFLDKELLKNIIRFSVSVFTVSLVDQVFWRSNQVLLGIFLGTSTVAVYSIAAQIYMNYMPISTVIQGVYLPKVTKSVMSNISDKELSDFFIRIGRIQFMMLSAILIGFILYGQDFINLWVGKNFNEAYWITLIILIPFTIDLIQNIGLTIMQAKNQYSFRAKLYIIMAFLNIVLSFILIPKYGVLGTAIALGFSLFIGNGIIMNVYYYYKVGINIPLFWKRILSIIPSFIIPVSIGYLIKWFITITNFASLGLAVIIFILVYMISVWTIGMDDFERNYFVSAISKFKK